MTFSCSLNCFSYLIVKSSFPYTRVITPKRVTSGWAHLRCLAPGQHSSEETSQLWQGVDDTVSDLTDPGFEPQSSRTDRSVLTTKLRLFKVLIFDYSMTQVKFFNCRKSLCMIGFPNFWVLVLRC